MNYAKLHLRNHLLAATMLDRWETFDEIIAALRKDYGLRATRLEVIEWMHEIVSDGYRLGERPRGAGLRTSGAKKELRLYAKSDAVNPPVPARLTARAGRDFRKTGK